MAATPARRWPTWCRRKLPEGKGTFHRDFTGQELTAAGRAEHHLPAGRRPGAQRRALEEDAADGQLPGSRRAQARRHRAAGIHARGQAASMPLLVTENYGRGRTVLFATEGSWRWKMWMDHDDKTHATFWQQMFRYLVTDTPGQVTATTPKAGAVRRHARADPRGSARQGVQARDQRQSAGALHWARMAPAPPWNWRRCRSKKASTAGEWTAEKPGSYVAEIIAGREQEEIGQRRADLPPRRRRGGELPYLAEPRAAGEALASRPAGGTTQPDEASKLASEISYSEAGITTRETRDLWDMPVVFLLALGIRAAEWLLRRKWGVV